MNVYVLKNGEHKGRWRFLCHLEFADTFFRRLVGLMFRKNLPEQKGLWIYPCKSVHTFFCRFPIDLCFLDEEGIIVKIVHSLKPWRISPFVRNAAGVLELPGGTCRREKISEGDQLIFDQ